jgi:hypothetical protein
MRTTLLLLLLYAYSAAQNDLRIYSANGDLFTLKVNGSEINVLPQSEVLAKDCPDTSLVIIHAAQSSALHATLYLLSHGEKTQGQEYAYRLDAHKGIQNLTYSGVSEIVRPPEPLVPAKPVKDTSMKFRNITLGHLCEIKNNKPLFFNNIPSSGSCAAPMPDAYQGHIKGLMGRAQTAEDRFRLAEQICLNNCMSVRQLMNLMTFINFEIEKLKIVRLGYFHLTDVKKADSLRKAFRFESSIHEFEYFLSHTADYKPAAVTSCTVAVHETQVASIREQLSVYTNDPLKLDALKKVSVKMCFSVNQVKLILTGFVHDREKLSAAMYMYSLCTEKANYSRVSEIFSDRNTGSQLEEFLRSQKKN